MMGEQSAVHPRKFHNVTSPGSRGVENRETRLLELFDHNIIGEIPS
jgi:hypothetical protein